MRTWGEIVEKVFDDEDRRLAEEIRVRAEAVRHIDEGVGRVFYTTMIEGLFSRYYEVGGGRYARYPRTRLTGRDG